MTAKTANLAFQPAPRPQSRITPEQSRQLAEATSDLGFGRTTSAHDPAHATIAPSPSQISPRLEQPSLAPSAAPEASEQVASGTAVAVERLATLKVAMPDETWSALRHEAVNRRVTVKYLVMEALAAKGYAVDLANIAEDGRRLR